MWVAMKTKISLALVLLLATSNAMAVSVPKEWKDRYVSLSKAFTTKDIKKLKSMFDKSFFMVSLDGKKSNYIESVAVFTELFKAKSIEGGEKIIGYSRKGDTVTITAEVNFKVTMPDDSWIKMDEVSVDTWKKINGKWLFVSAKSVAPTKK